MCDFYSPNVVLEMLFVHRNFEPKFVLEEKNLWFLLSQWRVGNVDSCVTDWLLSLSGNVDRCNSSINESVLKWILSKNVHQIFKPKFVREENNAWLLLSRCPVCVDSCVTDWWMSLSRNESRPNLYTEFLNPNLYQKKIMRDSYSPDVVYKRRHM